MKNLFYSVALFILLSINIFSQWSNIWISNSISYQTVSGWINFESNGNSWKSRLFLLDSLKFQVMGDGFSNTPQYTYVFTAAERLAGSQIYSLITDLTNDNITEFYVLAYHGTSTNYRQSFKILNIVNGATVFERNDPQFYFSYPSLFDGDNDGRLECIVTRYNYPDFANYFYEIFATGVTTSLTNHTPTDFILSQNFPNPFNPSTKINYSLSQSENVKLQIFNVQGEVINTLVDQFQQAGTHDVTWDGKNGKGISQPTGIYFYRLTASGNNSIKKMILLK